MRLAPAREADIVEELSQHLDDRYRESIAGGASPEDAMRLALDAFRSGNALAQHMSTLRQAHAPAPATLGAPTGHLLRDLWHDLRYAARTFRKQRAFASAAVLTLALGIGATAAIFSVVYGVLLKPLPFDEPENLVTVGQHAPHGAGTNQGPATYLTYRENQTAFEGIGVWDPTAVSVTGAGDPERVEALLVSSSTLPLLRVSPVLGRFFGAEDDTPNNPLRVVLTHGYWQRRFGGTENVVGQTLVIDGRPREVIGVLPSSFKFLSTSPEVLLPLPLDVNAPRGISFGFQALARLKPGVTLAEANTDAARVISLLPEAFARLELQPNVRPLADDVIGNVGEILWILLAAVGVVLLIACGNVANLFLVRAEGRHKELATRAALGASRARTARALLAESVVLALAGGVVGVALALAATQLLRMIAPAQLPRVDDIGINLPVLLFTFAVSVLSGVLFGLLAVLRFGSPSIAALKEGGRSGAGDAPGRHRTRNALVVGQVALALTLLICLGADDSDLRRDATSGSRFRSPAGGSDLRRRDTAGPYQRSARSGAHTRTRRRTPSAGPRSHVRRPLVVHHDGRRGQRQPDRARGRAAATGRTGPRSGGSRVSGRDISKRWEPVWSQDAPSRGATCTSDGR